MEISATKLNLALGDAKVEVMNFLNEIANRYPDAISFAPGRPREEHFDVAQSLGYIEDYVRHEQGLRGTLHDGYAALGQYGRTNGIIGGLIAAMLRNDEGIAIEADSVVVTVGCQEAMCLCLLALCGNPGDVVLVADPAYIGISGAARLLGIELAPVPCAEEGVDLVGLEATVSSLRAAGKSPRAFYFSPDTSNPTGVTTPRRRRAELLDLTQRLDIVVLEDQAYTYFQYGGERLPALKSMAASDHVIYLGSFSKSIYPGLRLGFIASDLRVRSASGELTALSAEISKIKSMLTVNTSPLCQAIAGGLLLRHECSLREFVAPRRQVLRENLDAMLAALAKHFPSGEAWSRGISWNRPTGGFFLCLKVPFAVTEEDLLVSAREYGVLWTPMSYFYLTRDASNEIRLAFSYATPGQIDKGISALADMIRARRGKAHQT
jgi:(S)-3,5-dihydroxyphenylglycine transaminase